MIWFFIFFFTVLLAGHGYVYWHVWQILPCGNGVKWVVLVLMTLAFACLFICNSPLQSKFPLKIAQAVYNIGCSWIFILLYLFMTFLLLDLGRLLHVTPKWFLHNSIVGTESIVILLVIVFTYGYCHYIDKYRETITLDSKGKLKKEMTVVMVSDLHIGYHNPRKELALWVDMLNAEHADLILVAGDIIDGSIRPVDEEHMEEEFRRLNAPVVACYGNHDYLTGIERSREFFKKAGIQLVQDSNVTIGDLCVIGRDDRTNRHRKSVKELTKAADMSKYTILLDHQPYHLEQAEQSGIDFQFSGHTHEGQVWPISLITHATYECDFGPWQRGDTQYYISSGLGIWGGKFRIGTRSEYVVATIK